MKTYSKAPLEEIVWGFDYADRLNSSDSIVASSWDTATGIDGANGVYSNTATQVEITGGTAGNQYLITNNVTTSQGEKFQRSFRVNVRDR